MGLRDRAAQTLLTGFASITSRAATIVTCGKPFRFLMWAALPEVARELRFWSSPCSNSLSPSLLLLLGILLLSCGVCVGCTAATIFWSPGCRRLIVLFIRWVAGLLDTGRVLPVGAELNLNRRLRLYNSE